MEVLFVHGMGRSPLSGWPLQRRLRRAGIRCGSFGYFAGAESFERIRARLADRVLALAARGDYVLIGHSLGGVLLRAALHSLPPGTRPPRRLFLLGSPVLPSRLALRLRHNPVFRLFTGDCGQLLGSSHRMQAVGPASAPTTSIVGARGPARRGPFKNELHDGVLAVSETRAEWISDQVRVTSLHTLLPASAQVAAVIVDRLKREA